MRFVKYSFSTLGLLWLTLLSSPYKLQYGEHGREYFDDDSIGFGIMLSVFFLLVHLFSSWLTTHVLQKKRAERADLLFGFCYLVLAGYYIYCATSNAAMHEC